MGKKNSTLNELAKFLAVENKNTDTELIPEDDYFQEKPVTLVRLNDEPISENMTESKSTLQNDTIKFIDSIAIRKTSFEDVHEQIKTLALENKISVQQVIVKLYGLSMSNYSLTNYMEWMTNTQKTYVKMYGDFQRKLWNR
jgi:hypothetical protein